MYDRADINQEAAIRAWKKGGPLGFKLLAKMRRFAALDLYRQRFTTQMFKPKIERFSEAHADSVASGEVGAERRLIAKQEAIAAVKQLGRKTAATVLLRAMGYSCREVAGLQRSRLGTVFMRISRARQKLKRAA